MTKIALYETSVLDELSFTANEDGVYWHLPEGFYADEGQKAPSDIVDYYSDLAGTAFQGV